MEMKEKKEITQQFLTGERVLFQGADLKIVDTIFDEGESPLKESRNIELTGSMFKWKYPLWYSRDIALKNCTIFEMGRAGIWYTNHISVEDTVIEAPKNFRRCMDIRLKNVNFMDAAETLWNCEGVEMEKVTAKGDYFAMNSQNLTLINCTIESRQGMCYIENLVMKNCKLINTTLAFEYSTVDAEITGRVDSILNPTSGTICAESICEIILEKDKISPDRTRIVCRDILKKAV